MITTMTKYIKILFIALSMLLTATSCEKFLDVQPRGNAIAETTEHYNGLFNSLSLMNFVLDYNDYSYWKNDEVVLTGESFDNISYSAENPQSILRAYEYMDGVYNADEQCSKIVKAYNQIYTYNIIANEVQGCDGVQATKDYLYAEARVTRAYLYFLLAQWFGLPYNESIEDTELILPIVIEANTSVNNYNRATMREMYDFIVNEMEEACPKLENRAEHKMRVYMPTGYAMLGKVYWMMGKYDKALEKLKVAYDLLKEDDNVTLTNYMTTQAAYGYTEVPVNMQSRLNVYKFRDPQVLYNKQNTLMTYFYFQYYGMTMYYLKQEYYDKFDEHDLRRNRICTVDAFGGALELPFAGFPGSFVNYGVEYQEVYLQLAECYARTGQLDKAKEIIEEFRSYRMYTGYAAVPSNVVTQNDYIRFCVDEQTREYIGTGYRWYNMRRLWNDPLFDHNYTHTYDGQTFTLTESQLKEEIPATVLMWNENW